MESAYSWLELVSTRYTYWTSYPNVGTVYCAESVPLMGHCLVIAEHREIQRAVLSVLPLWQIR